MRYLSPERRAIFLLFSIVLFFVLAPLLENDRLGELVLVLSMYMTLVAATMELAQKPALLWAAIPMATSSMVLLMMSHLHPVRFWIVANGLVLAAFIGLVCVSLFAHLGSKGQITSGGLYVSVSLYLLLGLGWWALYTLLNALQPGSFAEAGAALNAKTESSTILYFSLTTLTTLGYGDVVAVTPTARIFATWKQPPAYFTSPSRWPVWSPPIKLKHAGEVCALGCFAF